jgi:hypothetical protein
MPAEINRRCSVSKILIRVSLFQPNDVEVSAEAMSGIAIGQRIRKATQKNARSFAGVTKSETTHRNA